MPSRKPKITAQSTTYRIWSNPDLDVTISHKSTKGGNATITISLASENGSLGTKHWMTNKPFSAFTQVIAGVKTTKGQVKKEPLNERKGFEELVENYAQNPEALFSFIVEHMPGQNDEAIAAIQKATGIKNLNAAVALELVQLVKQKAPELMKQKKEAEAAEAA